jgi:hypothetical protein
MNTRPIIIVTTRLPPQVCGIGTYSWLLYRHWPNQDSEVHFLAIDGAAESIAALGHGGISDFDATPGKLARQLDRFGPANVLLHYAGRAYHRYGCPTWMPAVLAKWKAKFPAGHLLIFFHELPGNFPVISRYFWINLCSWWVSRKLARLADAIATNTAEHVDKIEKISGRRNAQLVPVPSNIEPANDFAEKKERTEFVIFGLPFGRWQTLQMFDSEIRSWQKSGRLTKLHLIGPPDDKFDMRSEHLIETWPKPNVVVRHGFLPAAQVSRLLARVQFGLTSATAGNWSKSATFMACAAHNCAVIGKLRSDSQPLCFTISPEEVSTISDVDLTERTRRLKEWYRENADWGVVAKKISALFPPKITEEAVT